MDPGKLRNRIRLHGREKRKNEIGEVEYEDVFIRKVWAQVIPQTGKLQTQQADTILSNVTHKIIVRYASDINQNMHIKYKGHRFDIKYILNPYFRNEFLEIFAEEVIE